MTDRPRVLLTGSSGRVGTAIASLLARDHEVLGIDLVPGPHTTHVGSIQETRLLAQALAGVDAIVHTAALHAPQVGIEPDRRFRAINVEATRTLLQLAMQRGIGRFVYTSSTSVFGHALVPGDAAVWVTEQLVPAPRDIYDETKLAAEALVEAASSEGRLTATILRMSRSFPEPEHLLATYRLYRGVDLRDVAHAHGLALRRQSGGCERFIVSARSPFRREHCKRVLEDPWSLVNEMFPRAARIYAERGWPVPAAIDRVYVTAKAEAMLGYSPRFNFEEALSTLPP